MQDWTTGEMIRDSFSHECKDGTEVRLVWCRGDQPAALDVELSIARESILDKNAGEADDDDFDELRFYITFENGRPVCHDVNGMW